MCSEKTKHFWAKNGQKWPKSTMRIMQILRARTCRCARGLIFSILSELKFHPLLIPTSLVNGGKRGGTAGPHFPRKRHGLFNAGRVPCASTSERECSHLSCTEMSSSRLTSSRPITPIANPTTQPPDHPLSLEMAHTHNEYIRREALP